MSQWPLQRIKTETKWDFLAIIEQRSDIPRKSNSPLKMKQSQTSQSKASNSSMAMIDCSLCSSLSLSLSPSLSPSNSMFFCYFYPLLFLLTILYFSLSLKTTPFLKKAKMTERIGLKGALSLVQINTHESIPHSIIQTLQNKIKTYFCLEKFEHTYLLW